MKKNLLLNPVSKQCIAVKTPLCVLLMFMIFFSSMNAIQAQSVSGDYSFSESTGVAYSDITLSGATSIISGAFGNVANFTTAYPIGFNFVFNNVTYSNVYVSDNGYIYFASPALVTPPAVTAFTPLSNVTNTLYGGCVAAYGNSLSGTLADNPSVSYLTTGVPGSRIFTVQYKNLRRVNITAQNGLMNFQIRLYEADNKVETLYDTFTTTYTIARNGQVGLRGTSPTDYNNRKNSPSNNFTPSIAGTANTDSMLTQLVGAVVWGPLAGTSFVWTPCFNPTALVTNLQGDNTTVDFSWTAPAYLSGTDYQWEVRTAGLPGTGAPFASGTTALTSASVTGLIIGQTYNFYVRSACKTIMPWTRSPAPVVPSDYISGSVTPSCATPLPVPYFQDFESSVIPAIPLCTQVLAVVDQPMVVRNYNVYGFGSKNLITGGSTSPFTYGTGSTNATDNWWFSQGINLAAAGKYKITFKYGGTRDQAFFTQRLKVAYGTARTVVGMSNTLINLNNIKTSPNTVSVNFTVGAGGTYYLGFNAYAAANNGYLQIDDISLVVTTCFSPTVPTATQLYTNSANISWTAPAVPPSGGYEYYYSTSNTPPTASTVPLGTTLAGVVLANLTGLTASTPYYFWVRSGCGGSDFSEWSTMGTFTTLTPPCIPAPTSIDGQGITNVTFGTINNTTVAEPGNYADYTSLVNNVSQTTNANISLTYTIAAGAANYWTRIWVDWNNDGDFEDTGELVYGPLSLNDGASAISFNVPTSVGLVPDTSGPHRMRIGGADLNNLAGFLPGLGPCYNGAFGSFEDYTINVIPPPPALTISSATTTFCSGNTSPVVTITTPLANFTSYTWSPISGVSGTSVLGYTFNPTVTTIYTLTATILTGGNFYTNTATYTVVVNPSPTPISIAPTSANYCQGDAPVLLTASGGIISGVPIFSENFNGGTNTFTLQHNSVNGNPTLAWWTLRPSPYSIPTANTDDPITIISNDSSQFYMSDSDIQGSAGNTNELLISPVFSLVGYTDANLSFWHHYKQFSNGSASVEISTNGGGSYTALPGATWTTTSQGTPTGFVNVVLNLSAYAFAGNTNNNMRIRFRYVSNYGYRWCIDNVVVSGSSTSNTIWSPNIDLFTNALGTIPYDGVSPRATIYAKPTITRTYTTTVTTPGPAFCPRTNTVVVTFVPLVGGNTTGNQTVTCGSAPAAISVSGYLPNLPTSIVRWESSSDFAFTTPVTVGGSANQITLTPLLLGTVTTTTYYRAVITGCNTVYSDIVTITVDSATWDGFSWAPAPPTPTSAVTITGPLTINADVTYCSMKVDIGGTVTVNPGVTLTLDNALVVVPITPGTVTFRDTSSLLQNNTSNTINAGNITYEKDIVIRKFDYTYWSTPVFIQTLQSFSPNTLSDKYFLWNTTFAAWTNIVNTSPMAAALGYIIRGPQLHPLTPAPLTLRFVGIPNNGNQTVPIVKSALPNGDFNCIGNPYLSAIDADLFVLNNPAAFPTGTTMYFWTHNTAINPITLQYDGVNDFALYNSSGGTGAGTPATFCAGCNLLTPNGKIATGQGFLVRATFAANGTQTATFTNAMRISGGNDRFFRVNQNNEKNRLWLDLTYSNQSFKQILVGYIQNATNEFEAGFDGEVMESENPMDFYSLVDTKKLGIQGRALPFDGADIVPLGFKATLIGTYTISLSKFDGLFSDESVAVYLEDRLLNTSHNLRVSPYNFVSEIGVFESRFVLRYSNLLSVNPSQLDEKNVVIFKQHNNIHIETSKILMKEVRIFDIRGRLILEKNNINSISTVFENVAVANQVLVVQVTSMDGSKVDKKIIF